MSKIPNPEGHEFLEHLGASWRLKVPKKWREWSSILSTHK